jgi:two-component system LytT family response regulator
MLKAIIVDDEPNSREMLAEMLKRSFNSKVEVAALCKNVAEGVEAIHSQNPDVVFLDIEMPNESGFELIKKVSNYRFLTVFVTAYSEHAIKAFKVNALDYLLKPVQRTDLEETIEKLINTMRQGVVLEQQQLLQKLIALSTNRKPKIGLPSSRGMIFIEVEEIIRCEADDNYTIVVMSRQKHIVSKTLKDVEEALRAYNFIRVHKSHLINLGKVERYQKHDGGVIILEDDSRIPVGRHNKEELERRLHSF